MSLRIFETRVAPAKAGAAAGVGRFTCWQAPAFAGATVLLLAACGQQEQGEPQAEAAARGDPLIECATSGQTRFEAACSVATAVTAEGTILRISAADGGFRRLRVTNDGRGMVAADGAEPAIVTPVGADMIEVAIGGDRYRLPAKVK